MDREIFLGRLKVKYIAQLAGVIVFALLGGGLTGYFGLNPDDRALIKYSILIPCVVVGYFLGGKIYDRFWDKAS